MTNQTQINLTLVTTSPTDEQLYELAKHFNKKGPFTLENFVKMLEFRPEVRVMLVTKWSELEKRRKDEEEKKRIDDLAEAIMSGLCDYDGVVATTAVPEPKKPEPPKVVPTPATIMEPARATSMTSVAKMDVSMPPKASVIPIVTPIAVTSSVKPTAPAKTIAKTAVPEVEKSGSSVKKGDVDLSLDQMRKARIKSDWASELANRAAGIGFLLPSVVYGNVIMAYALQSLLYTRRRMEAEGTQVFDKIFSLIGVVNSIIAGYDYNGQRCNYKLRPSSEEDCREFMRLISANEDRYQALVSLLSSFDEVRSLPSRVPAVKTSHVRTVAQGSGKTERDRLKAQKKLEAERAEADANAVKKAEQKAKQFENSLKAAFVGQKLSDVQFGEILKRAKPLEGQPLEDILQSVAHQLTTDSVTALEKNDDATFDAVVGLDDKCRAARDKLITERVQVEAEKKAKAKK